MKIKSLACLALLITGCTGGFLNKLPLNGKEKELSPAYFSNMDACFILYNVKTREIEKMYGQARCQERVAPCSTFKVPLAVMAADADVLTDEHMPMKWNHSPSKFPAWNKDQDATSWMKESVVWYSQALTKKMGREQITNYLKKFDYGNKDFSGDIDTAWLTPNNSLKISAFEQLEFMRKLWSNELLTSKRSTELARNITFIANSRDGYTLSGKTGSGFTDDERKFRLGWFVAHVEGNSREYITIFSFTDSVPKYKGLFAGPQARAITEQILRDNSLFAEVKTP